MKEGQMTGIVNSVLFHINPAVDFDFADTRATLLKEGAVILRCLSRSVMSRDRGVCHDL
jgi:hypothetical protein